MIDIDKDYLITVDLKNSSVKSDRTIVFYNTDLNICNIFIKLICTDEDKSIPDDLVVELAVLKSESNEFKTLNATLISEEDLLYEVDLTTDYFDIVGKYECEIRISGTVDGEMKCLTSESFNYIVKPNITAKLDNEIKNDKNLPVLEKLIKDVKELSLGIETNQVQMKTDENLVGDNKTIVGAINQLREDVNSGIGGGNVDLTNYQKKTDETLQTTSKEIVGAINEVNTQVEENQIDLVEDDISMEGISDTVYDILETNNKTIIGAINEVNKKAKENKINLVEDDTYMKGISDTVYDTLETNNKTIIGAINEVFQNASNGKTLIAQAITGKGILTNANDSFQTMATNISNIKSEETIECTGLILSKTTLTFSDLITRQALSVTVAPPNSTYPVFWYSTNENIATVSNGVVTPITNGSCSIIVCCGEKMAKCDVVVEEQIKLNKVNSSLRITKLYNGTIEYSTDTIIATIPSSLNGQTIKWSVNNSNVTLTPNGNKCTITASVLGDSIITITCGNKKATCNVSVLKGISGEVVSQYTNVTDGLILNLEVKDGRIIDTVSNTEFIDDKFTVEDGYIKVIGETSPGTGAILNVPFINIDGAGEITINSPLTVECCELQRNVDPLHIIFGFRAYPTGNIYTPFAKNSSTSFLALDGKNTYSTWKKIASFDNHFSS